MKKLTTLLLAFYLLLTLSSCAYKEPSGELEASQEPSSAESHAAASPTSSSSPDETVEFFGETYRIADSDYTEYDEGGVPTFVFFHDVGFIGLSYGDEEPIYQQVKLGQVVCGATVSEGTSMGFDLIDGECELTESDVRFTGPMTFLGNLTKISEGDMDFRAPGTLIFTVTYSESGFTPYKYGFASAPEFMLDGYDPETDYPELFSENNTVYVKVTLDSFMMLKTNRATGVNRATLASVELLDKTQ